MTFSKMILALQNYWEDKGCALIQPFDMPSGAGTFHHATFLKSLESTPWAAAYVAPSRRPTDGRYGDNPNRLGAYYQFQVIIKPPPANIQELYLKSLEALGFDLSLHDVRFVEDNWESPSLGAWGLGWEVWLDGMEITQFTYFQQVGGFAVPSVSVELTYGLERLAMYLQDVDNVYDLIYSQHEGRVIKYGDIFKRAEYEYSKYSFEGSDAELLNEMFDSYYKECKNTLSQNLALPAYDYCLLAAHFFNLLDARGVISVAKRQDYMLKVRELSKECAKIYKKGLA